MTLTFVTNKINLLYTRKIVRLLRTSQFAQWTLSLFAPSTHCMRRVSLLEKKKFVAFVHISRSFIILYLSCRIGCKFRPTNVTIDVGLTTNGSKQPYPV